MCRNETGVCSAVHMERPGPSWTAPAPAISVGTAGQSSSRGFYLGSNHLDNNNFVLGWEVPPVN